MPQQLDPVSQGSHRIVKKLERLGYKKDLEGMRYPDPLDSQPWVSKAQRLTDRGKL
jgi:hypothetical protein